MEVRNPDLEVWTRTKEPPPGYQGSLLESSETETSTGPSFVRTRFLFFPPTHPGEIVVSGRPLCDDRPRARLFVLFETPTLSRATEFTRRTTGCS